MTPFAVCLEGWYVVPDARRRGIGAALVGRRARAAASLRLTRTWTTRTSHRAHLALGFTETGRNVHFGKDL